MCMKLEVDKGKKKRGGGGDGLLASYNLETQIARLLVFKATGALIRPSYTSHVRKKPRSFQSNHVLRRQVATSVERRKIHNIPTT